MVNLFTDLHAVVYTCFFALVGNGVELFGKGLEFEIGYYELCHDNLRKGEVSVGILGLSLFTSVLYPRKRRISIQHHNLQISTFLRWIKGGVTAHRIKLTDHFYVSCNAITGD